MLLYVLLQGAKSQRCGHVSQCIKLDLIAGNTLFVDSTRVRANASIKNTWTKEKCETALEKIDSRIEAILSECDAIDQEEENQDSLIKVRKELRNEKALKAKVKAILKELKQTKKKSIISISWWNKQG